MKTAINPGTKCTCTMCKTKFYDLNREGALCPNCGHTYTAPVIVLKAVKPPRSARRY